MSYIEIKEYKEELVRKGFSKRYVEFFEQAIEIYDKNYYDSEFNLKEIEELCGKVYNGKKLEVKPFGTKPLGTTSCVFCERNHSSVDHYNFFRDVFTARDKVKRYWYSFW